MLDKGTTLSNTKV